MLLLRSSFTFLSEPPRECKQIKSVDNKWNVTVEALAHNLTNGEAGDDDK